MSNNNGGPAFPLPEAAHPGAFPPDVAKDMTLRDYFAGKAMAAMISTSAGPCLGGLDGYELYNAKAAYKMADAMLKASGGGE